MKFNREVRIINILRTCIERYCPLYAIAVQLHASCNNRVASNVNTGERENHDLRTEKNPETHQVSVKFELFTCSRVAYHKARGCHLLCVSVQEIAVLHTIIGVKRSARFPGIYILFELIAK